MITPRSKGRLGALRRQTQFFLVAAVLLSGLTNCSREDIHPAAPRASATVVQNVVPTHPLNWESIDWMPTPPGMPAVLVPWASGTSRQFTRELMFDYKKADGWELVYNTFNTQQAQDNYYFILYNKYRGLLRMYYYLPSTVNLINSDNVIHKLGVEGPYAPSSPIMNFAAQPVVGVGSNSSSAVTAEPWQLARSTWYLFQYELAYDQNMSMQDYSRLNFSWQANSLQVTRVNLAGGLDGGLTGTISLPGTNINLSPSVSRTLNVAGEGQIIVNGSSGADKLLASLGSAVVSGIKKSITDGVSGLVSNLLSGIFGSKSGQSEENVDLKLKARINLEGTLTSNVLITAPTLAVPGSSQGQTVGYVPAYDKPLGVFYLREKPVIIQQKFIIPQGGLPARVAYSLFPNFEENVAKLIINPEVSRIATIQNISQEVVVEDDGNVMISGSREQVAKQVYYIGSILQFERPVAPIVGVRIAFDVVPNDGSPKSRLVKTFAAAISEQVIEQPPGEDPF